MKVSQWVDFGQEVRIEIGVEEIRGALAEHFSSITDRDIDPVTWREITTMLNIVAQFFKALTDEQIASIPPAARAMVHGFLSEQVERFKP